MVAECTVGLATATVRNVVWLLVRMFRIRVHVQSCAGRRGKFMVRISEGVEVAGKKRGWKAAGDVVVVQNVE
jgi:hypothetical protein